MAPHNLPLNERDILISMKQRQRSRSPAVHTPGEWLRLISGLAITFAVFHWSADRLQSMRGEEGVTVCLIVLVSLAACERMLFGVRARDSASALGLGRPRGMGLAAAVGIGALLLCVAPLFAIVTGASVSLTADWLSVTPGLLAQGGVAEEALFRGYLFRRLRQGRSFWRAALLSMLPFALVHLILFITMPWALALAALILSLAVSFPLARLYELGGDTVWAPAFLHFVIQGFIKVLVMPEAVSAAFALIWMGASALIPWLVFRNTATVSGNHGGSSSSVA
jgi:membrane protease YdiL (CAAX protease family)